MSSESLVQHLCRDLRLLWTEAGGPTLRVLSAQVRRGKSQVGAILNGDIRQLPDWDVVKGLVDSFRRHAQDNGRFLSLSTGIDEYWRPRYTMVEHARGQPSGLIPRQLPPAVRHLVGRAEQWEALSRLLPLTRDSVVIAVIDGTAGIGKTTLAVSWAHSVTRRFADGQLYANLRGFDPSGSPMSPAEVVRGFLDALLVPAKEIPSTLDAQIGLYRSLLAGKRVLIVLDNAFDEGQVRPVLPGAAGCLVVVTSRNRLHSLIANDGGHPLSLDPLSPNESRSLLDSRLDPARVEDNPAALDDIVSRCSGLPLALAIVAARAAMRPGFPLEAVAAELHETQGDLDAVFDWSYRTLSPPAARLFRLLGSHPGPDIAVPAAASLAGLPVPQVRQLLSDLTNANLLTELRPGRYGFHDLLRAYAAAQSDEGGPAALQRMFDHYLHTAHTGALALESSRDPMKLEPPMAGVVPETLCDGALAWFDAEHKTLLRVIERAAMTGFHLHAWQLAWCLIHFLEWQGHWLDMAATQSIALDAAGELKDKSLQAMASRLLARAELLLGRHDNAEKHLRQALDFAREHGDPLIEAHAHTSLCWVLGAQNRYLESVEHAQQGLELFRAAGHRIGQARALNLAADAHANLGNPQQAMACCEEGIALLEPLNERATLPHIMDTLGYSCYLLGHHEQAIVHLRHALGIFRDFGNRYFEAEVLTHLGQVHDATGDSEGAHEAWRQALEILQRLGHAGAATIQQLLSGAVRPERVNPLGVTSDAVRDCPELSAIDRRH